MSASSSLSKHIVFVDNAEEFWFGDVDMYADSINYVPVSNRVPTDRDREDKYTKDLAKIGNRYAMAIVDRQPNNFVNRGLDKRTANKLKEWSLPNFPDKLSQKYALFDWDGTISATEGFCVEPFGSTRRHTQKSASLFLNNKTRGRRQNGDERKRDYNLFLSNMIKSQIYKTSLHRPLNMPSQEFLDDMFVYLMKPSRVEMLRDLFQTLLQNGVKVHIVTHNPYASVKNPIRRIFIEMIWRLVNSSISRGEIDAILHSTMDYTKRGEPYLKRNMVRGILHAK
jgi:hypothetical protein